jgi:Outer membrane protein beta-barrel domain
MRTFPRIALAAASLALVALPLHAQSFSIGLRGISTLPIGDSADPQASSSGQIVSGASSGFGYGLDLGLAFGPLGIYGGFDHVKFGCGTPTCPSDGRYTLQGVTLGLKATAATSGGVRPFVKGGVTFNSLEGTYVNWTPSGGVLGDPTPTPFSSDRAPGFELGAGADVSFLGVVSLSPQVRYIGQNLKLKVPGVSSPTTSSQGFNYFTFDVALSFHSPLGRRQ